MSLNNENQEYKLVGAIFTPGIRNIFKLKKGK